MTKKITRQQLAGSQGEAFVRERAHDMGFLFNPYGQPEAGIDGLLELRDPATGEVKGQLVAAQVKTRDDGNYTAETDSTFEYLLDSRDVEYWRQSNLPVIIVLVHLGRKEAYWKSVDAGTGLGTRRLLFDKTKDRFDAGAREAIAALCVAKGGWGVWFPPLQGGEPGHLNMVEVVLPETIYVAASPYKTGKQALAELLAAEARPPYDWVIRGGQFLSFSDPRGGPLEVVIDAGSVDDIPAEEIAFPDDEADERNVIEILRRTLGAQLDGLLSFSRDQKAFYFPAMPGSIERTYHYTSLKQKTSADVVKKYEKDGKLKFVRHHAFEPRFWRLGDSWMMSISPTFVFTWDGFRPDRFASGRLAGKKQREFNSSLLGQFVMWRNLLTGLGAPAANAELFAEPERAAILRFKALEVMTLPKGVPDELWRASEPELPADNGQGRFAL
ncbi:DUF4365 domain-containing protein [Mesorhizobium sp.]|uniref:DUF4365 domain-containing protein n=1 Tax=Mesorhizobium sp. TaxID=1871066 RepID=UPI000FE92018|nr:DUF4365 domain-containing protein [Mesorhizobium sp.]RWJ32028.1 MAG: DUF4365 domain-containing protein [Mesorhizobium sp.]TIQ73765.1 MAG: DUF4365 domain-containing protein [Mesorhizobium sp.]